jgi:ribonuclease T2
MRLVAAAIALMLCAAAAVAQETGRPGQFDYYVLSLSWSPTWCGTKQGRQDAEQCGGQRRYGFVVHGLWPQYSKGGYPAQCASPEPLPTPLVESMLPVMPSRQLIWHEWKKHGTCAGSAATDYFAKTRAAYERVRIPKVFQAADQPQTLAVEQIEKLFQAANPTLAAESVSVVCRGHHAAEVRVCVDKDLNFRPCARDVRDRCKGNQALFPAVR